MWNGNDEFADGDVVMDVQYGAFVVFGVFRSAVFLSGLFIDILTVLCTYTANRIMSWEHFQCAARCKLRNVKGGIVSLLQCVFVRVCFVEKLLPGFLQTILQD